MHSRHLQFDGLRRHLLHIGFEKNRDDLLLILFSALLLIIMVAGTIWIMASLALRMAMQ